MYAPEKELKNVVVPDVDEQTVGVRDESRVCVTV